MSRKLQQRIEKARAAVCERAAGDDPTLPELWRYHLVETVKSNLLHPDRAETSKSKYTWSHFAIYAHHDMLKACGNVAHVPDSILLEALGMPDVENWGWLIFMYRSLCFVALLAHNWNIPHVEGGFGSGPKAPDSDQLVFAARCFLDLMRARGEDPIADLRDAARREFGAQMGEEEFAESLRDDKNRVLRLVYTCETTSINPLSFCPDHAPGNPCDDWYRNKLLPEIRAAQLPA